MKLPRHFYTITAFAIAMGFLEAAVVVYLREILYPGGFRFPLSPVTPDLAITELFRELATLVMLLSIGILAGRKFSTGFAWFIYSFAIWDIFYYVFLKAVLGWPESLMTWDVLFLIPTTWTGPVLTPIIISLSMILLAGLILYRDERNLGSRIPGKIWGGLIAGSLIIVIAWILDYTRHMLRHFSFVEMLQVKNQEVLRIATLYEPDRFPWLLFGLGELIILAFMAWYYKRPST